MPSTRNKDSKRRRDKTQWILAIEDSVLQSQNKDEDNRPVFVKLEHPKTNDSSMFMFACGNKEVYEVLTFHEEYRSWFIGQSVQHDGSLYMTTRVDPLFLCLPYFVRSAKSGKFMTLDQIVSDEKHPECFRLHQCAGINDLDIITDTRGDDDLRAYRYNQEKTLEWLKFKVERLAEVLAQKNVHVAGGAQSATFVRSNKSNDAKTEDFQRYACGMISDYLSENLSSQLQEYLGIKDVPVQTNSVEPPKKKAKVEVAPLEDYSSNGNTNETEKKTAGKKSIAQKKLNKVDKTGMKSIASFFSPKEK